MTVAFDSSTTSSEWHMSAGWGEPNPFTFSGPAPSATPKGVVVFVVAPASALDAITGITYGGTAMTRIEYAQDTAIENMGCYSYFLGSSVPAGQNTVAVSYNNADGGECRCVCIVATAGDDTEILAHGKVQQDAANPSVTLDTGSTTSLRLVAMSSGADTAGAVTLGAGLTSILGDKSTNLNATRFVARQTTPASGSVAVGYTVATDDCAMTAVAVSEVASVVTSDNFDPYGRMGFFGL